MLAPMGVVAAATVTVLHVTVDAQDRLKSMPGYAQYDRMSREIPTAVKSGALGVTWTDANTFEYRARRQALSIRRADEVGRRNPAGADQMPAGRGGRGGGPARGRQVDSSVSPDGKLKASYHDRNLWLSDPAGGGETAITTDGSDKARIKYGTASWVYGEELSQTTAMWWAPDSARIAYYRFDEQKVPDYFLQMDQTKIQSTGRHRGLSESGCAQSGRRSLRLRRCDRRNRRALTSATASRSTIRSSGTTSTT